jgi:hypothetical protein
LNKKIQHFKDQKEMDTKDLLNNMHLQNEMALLHDKK